MKFIEEVPQVYLEKYDIHVNQYLTYAQIQDIVNSTVQLSNTIEKDENGIERRSDSWSERQINIDMRILLMATDISKEDLVKINHNIFLQNGIVDAVKDSIKNLWQLEEALHYTESWHRALAGNLVKVADILKRVQKLPNIKEQFIKNVEDNSGE